MKSMRIADNTAEYKSNFSHIDGIVEKVADKTLEQLEREGIFVFPEFLNETEDITREQMILQSVNDTYRTGNVMGYLGYGEERLVIHSRFGNGDNDFFFQYLLEKVLDLPNIVDMKTDSTQSNRLFSYLMFLFPYYLKSAMRKGLLKKYIRRSYNDDAPKGTIEISQHIRKNTPFVGNIAYSQREFSYDNLLTELIRHTIEYIKTKPYGQKLLFRSKDEVRALIDATGSYKHQDRKKIIEQNIKNPLRHAYYREYRALQRLCILILQHRKHLIGSGTRQIYGILFDGAWLWEEYVNTLISEKFYHPKNKAGMGGQKLFDKNIGLIYPDFISRDADKRTIADAKYKFIGGIGGKDYLQVLAYMFRFDAKQGYFLYPEPESNQDLLLRLNSGSTYEKNEIPRNDVTVCKHGLKIPMCTDSYEDFVCEITCMERSFISEFGI